MLCLHQTPASHEDYVRLLALIASVFSFIFRKLRIAGGSLSVGRVINKLKKGEASAADVAEGLDIPYHTIPNINESGFLALAGKIKEGVTLGNYRILYSTLVPPNQEQLLVFTELSFNDYTVTLTEEEGKDVKSKAYHNFVLKFDPVKSTVTTWSTLFSDNTEKFQKQEFLKTM